MKHMISAIILVLVIIATSTPVFAQTFCPLKFHDCGSVAGGIFGVSFNGTCNGGEAVLKKGTVIVIDFNFSSKNDEYTLNSEVAGKIGDLPYVKFPLRNPDACKDSGLACPIKANTKQDYKPLLDVLTSFPSVDNVYVRWELKNKDGKDVFCAILLAQITK